MLRMMIIEDELWMRRGLETMLAWDELQIQHVASAKNGREALGLMAECKPDIIMTDIKMPIIDGFTMLDKLSESIGKLPKIIIISGYNEFDYAKKAIRHGVVDYILKPVDPEELKNSVIKISKIIMNERKDSQSFTQLELKNVIYEKLAFPLNNLRADFIPISFYYCLIFTSDPIDKGFMKKIEHEMYIITLSIGIHELTLIGCMQENTLASYVNELQHDQAIGVSSIKSNINDSFFVAYREAEQAFQSTFNQHTKHHKFHELNLNISREEETTILKALQKGNKQLVHKAINSVLDKYPIFEQKWIIQFQFYLFLCRYLTADQMKASNQVMWLHKFKSIYTLTDLLHFYDLVFEPMIDDITRNFNPSKTNYILQVKEYIDCHYKSSSLSLDEASEHLNLTPAYLSYIFKKETGINFTSYVTKKRIETAKNLLLSSSLTIYEVSVEVGFNDVKYFIKVFKKETGFTPNRYREINV